MGDPVIFNALGSSDNVGIVSYFWDFGDGFTDDFMSTTHVYMEPGIYTVTLTVQDGAGNSAEDIALITVEAITGPTAKRWGIPVWMLYILVIVVVLGLIIVQ